MNIQILGIGKVKEPYYREGMEEFLKRLSGYSSVEIREVPKERSERESDKEKAYSSLRKTHLKADIRVALEEGGQQKTSQELASWLGDVIKDGVGRVSFLLGGPHGLCKSAIDDSNMRLSLSAMTLPHQMARLLLVEQLYRAFTILRGEPYHK